MKTFIKWLNESGIEYYIEEWGIGEAPLLKNVFFIYNNKALKVSFRIDNKGNIEYGNYFIEDIESGLETYVKTVKKIIDVIINEE